jgi:hypothetical protein
MDQATINKSLIGVALLLFAVLSFLTYKAVNKNAANTTDPVTGYRAVAPSPTGVQLTQPNLKERAALLITGNKIEKDTVVLATNQMLSLVNQNASEVKFLPPTGDVTSDITLPDGRLYEMRFNKPGTYNMTLKFANSTKDLSIIVL